MPREGPELQLQRQVVQLAEMLGWEHLAIRPMLTKSGFYKAGTMGTMAKGWPDLTMVRARDRRLIFAELKGSKRDKLWPDQERVLEVLRELEMHADQGNPHVATVEVYVWRPDDWPEIELALR